MFGSLVFPCEAESISSLAPAGPWGHSLYGSISHLSSIMQHRGPRSTLTRYNTGLTLPQVQSVTGPSAFGVKFHKWAQVQTGTEFPHLMFFLLIHNIGPVGGTNLSQLAIRDSVSGIAPLDSGGRVVEKGYQTFAIDSLPGSYHVIKYTALIKNHKSEIIELPAFLTFSNASQNDVNMFGPLVANFTLRVNSTDKIYPNHGVHFAGFVGGFFLSLVLLSLGFLAMNLQYTKARMNSLQQRKKRGDSDPEYAVCDMSEAAKEEAAFEDKMVDIMVLEDPQNMYRALENLEMSSLLRATSSLETTRVQIYKDMIALLLGGLHSEGQTSSQSQQRLLSVLHGQLMGMEGKLKEEHVARMAALADQCNLETREEMEVERRLEAAEKAEAELLCRHAENKDVLQCSVLLEELHKLNQSHLQHTLLVRHEEASAKVQRQVVEWRRVELHKIFAEELEEATRMGEMEKSAAKSLLHDYYTCQDQLEKVLDVVTANQRAMLGGRHAQRKFLVHSLHSLKGLISDTFANTSSQMDCWFNDIRKGGAVSEEEINQVQDKAQKDLMLVRQGLDEALTQERRAMHCGLVKKRRDLISETLQGHKQRQKELSCVCRGLVERVEPSQHLLYWQSLLTAQCLELGELINNLDEGAAADIRKVTMRLIHSALVEVKNIQPAAALALWPSGAPRSFLQPDPCSGPGLGASALAEAQERLHQEGKMAVRTLRSTREALQEGMEKELQEQQELRARVHTFFRILCSSQLSLSDEDLLRMKLEFQKCLSKMDHCLVLPHSLSRSKLQTSLSNWRKIEDQTKCKQPERKTRSKEKCTVTIQKPDYPELLLFQKRLVDSIHLFEKEKEIERSAMEMILEEMRIEREEELLTQADSLAIQMAKLQYQKAERKTKVLETSRAMLTLQSLLIEELRARRSLGGVEMLQNIQSHYLGLENAEQQLQEERTEFEVLESGHARHRPFQDPKDSEREEDDVEARTLFHVQHQCRMATILQEALNKCEQVSRLMTQRLQESSARSQAMEDLKEQLELKWLYANCDQDLEFAALLVKQSQVSIEVLLKAVRLLLPTLPESELLSIINALCPKQALVSPNMEQENTVWPEEASRSIIVQLWEGMVCSNALHPIAVKDRIRFKENRQCLLEKLFPNPQGEALQDVMPVLVQEKREKGAVPNTQQPSYKPVLTGMIASEQLKDSVVISAGGTVDETLFSPCELPGTSCSSNALMDIPTTGERVFVFRIPPEPQGNMAIASRKRKRNFLNLKKCSVSPTDQL
ncbi:limbin-like isoform X2 [Hypomesus transpacificus]|uniref:limbin-like isoform X2 n=1 Tax=Hypomesus transpacificus TaxID=137520 RepID=UPI001F07A353|nr:limbin-like isoform X2 [Hypomesus transpacificus]